MSKAIENAFVESWEEWDQLEVMAICLYDCVLVDNVAEQVGFKHASRVNVWADCGKVEFYAEDDKEPVTFNFSVTLGDKI